MNSVMKKQTKIFEIKAIAQIGVLSAIAVVLTLFEIPLWFAPSFYKLDFSEVVVLIGSFAIGPAAGVMIEFVKIMLNLLINGTTTGGIGEFANFIIGCALVVPSALIYRKDKSKKNAIIGLLVGTATLTVAGCLLNYFVLLPIYAGAFGIRIDTLVKMGSAVNASITDLKSFVVLAVAPFNLLKGVVVSIITMLIYKKVTPILRGKI